MDYECSGSAGGGRGNAGGGGHNDQGSEGSDQRNEKRKRSDLEASMQAMKDAVVKENAEKSAKICRLMEEIDFPTENPSFTGGLVGGVPLQNPFSVFPKVVWECIIDKLNRSSDLELLCLAFPQLEGLVMEKKKTIVLFKNVFPFICKHLLGEDIKNCRLVCGTWNEVVCDRVATWTTPNLLPNDAPLTNNEIFTKTPLPEPLLAEVDENFLLQLYQAYLFYDNSKIQKFLDKMADHQGNPFVGRLLCLVVPYRSPLKHSWDPALELVRKFGEQVWNLEITRHCGGEWFHNEVDFYKAVQQVLIHVPNLRYLTVVKSSSEEEPSQVDMAVEIRKSPLPPLPYLQSLKLYLDGEPGMSSAFSMYFSSQIGRLDLLSDSFANLTDDCLRELVNVEQLEVELHSKEDMSRLLEFPNAENVKILRLHTINVPFSHPRKSPISLAPEQFANLLEKFSGLERPLDITRCRIELSSFLSSRERFSGLTTLKIGVGFSTDSRQCNLDFLLWFQSLKHLMIDILFVARTFNPLEQYDQDCTLKIWNYLYEGQMLDSNIWTLMPSLKLLEAVGNFHTPNGVFPRGNGIYTREMYENRVD